MHGQSALVIYGVARVVAMGISVTVAEGVRIMEVAYECREWVSQEEGIVQAS